MSSTEAVSPVFEVCGLSRPGRRSSNEDSAAWAAYGPDSSVRAWAVVCDGMGGHNAGEVASSMALRIVHDRVGDLASERLTGSEESARKLREKLEGWVLEINGAIRARGAENIEQRGMGTTIALAVVVGEKQLAVANVGDSKIFLLRGLTVQQLSVDHTALAEQRRALGRDAAAPEDDAGNPFAHALTRSLGQEQAVLPDVRVDIDLAPGDLVIVTSDGVTDVLESERFISVVETCSSLDEVAESIYRLSYDAGSRDNITVALLAWGSPKRLGTGRSRLTARPGDGAPLEPAAPQPRKKVPPIPFSQGSAGAESAGGGASGAPLPPLRRKLPPAVLGGMSLAGLAALFLLVRGFFSASPSNLAGAEPTPAPSSQVPASALAPSPKVVSVSPSARIPVPTALLPEDSPVERAQRTQRPAPAGLSPLRAPVSLGPAPLAAAAGAAVPPASAAAPPVVRSLQPVETAVAPAPALPTPVPQRETEYEEVVSKVRLASVTVSPKESFYIISFQFDQAVRGAPSELEASLTPSRVLVGRESVSLMGRQMKGAPVPLKSFQASGRTVRARILKSNTNFDGKTSLESGTTVSFEFVSATGRPPISGNVQ